MEKRTLTVNIALSLVCLRDKQIRHVPPDAVLITNGVAAEDLLQNAGVGEGSVAVLALDHRDHLRRGLALVLEPPHLDRGQGAVGRICQSVRQLFLHQLVLGDRVVLELPPLQRVSPRTCDAVLKRTHGAHGDAVPRAVEAREGTPEALDFGEHVRFGHRAVVHLDHARDASPQPVLVLDRWRLKCARRAVFPLDQEPTNLARLVQLGPHHQHVGDGAVCDPGLCSVQHKIPLLRRVWSRRRLHGARVAAMVRLGQSKGTKHSTLGHLRQELLFLLFGAKLVDTTHDKGRLYRHARPVAAVDSFDCSRDETRRYRADSSAPVTFKVGTE